MFTTLLEKDQKQCLLELAHFAMNADGKADELEMQIIENLEIECGLQGYKPGAMTIDQTIAHISTAPNHVKRAILIEVISIILCDEILHDAEEKLIEKTISAWRISEQHLNTMIDWVKEFNRQLDVGYQIVKGDHL